MYCCECDKPMTEQEAEESIFVSRGRFEMNYAHAECFVGTIILDDDLPED